MKPIDTRPSGKEKRFGIHVGLILLTSVTLGMTYNALNPVGLKLGKPSAEQLPAQATISNSGIYNVETLYAVPALSSGEPVSESQPAAASPPSMPQKSRSIATASQTTWEKAQPLVQAGEVVLVDSRPRLSYEAGHIPKAISFPENEFASRIASFHSKYPPSSSRVVIYCSDSTCGSSAKLASTLTQKYGYQHVQYVPGGYLDWLKTQGNASK